MALRFVDRDGNEGWIQDDLSVEYVGGLDVQGAVDRIVEDDVTAEESLNELIVRLPQTVAITCIERG